MWGRRALRRSKQGSSLIALKEIALSSPSLYRPPRLYFPFYFTRFLGHWLAMPVLGSNPTVIKIQEGLFIYKNSAVRLSSIECFD